MPLERRSDESRYVGGFPHRAVFDYSYDGAMRSVEQSLLRLGLDRIDILLAAALGCAAGGPARTLPSVTITQVSKVDPLRIAVRPLDPTSATISPSDTSP